MFRYKYTNSSLVLGFVATPISLPPARDLPPTNYLYTPFHKAHKSKPCLNTVQSQRTPLVTGPVVIYKMANRGQSVLQVHFCTLTSNKAIELLLSLGGNVFAAVIAAARDPLIKIAIELTNSFFARLSPSRENNTITRIEDSILARKADKNRLEELEKIRVINERLEESRLALEIEDRKAAKDIEDRRVAQEIEELSNAELDRKTEERRLAQEIEHRKVARDTENRGLAQEIRNRRLANGIKDRRLAREIEEHRNAELDQKAEEDRARELEVKELHAQKVGVTNEISMMREEMSEANEQPGKRNGIPGITDEEFRLAKEKIQYCPGQFRFAVSGGTGTGKSSLINNFLNLDDNDINAAPVGIVETTFTIGRYPDPGDQPPRKWTVWYDIPGSGSSTFKDQVYFKEQCLFMFDLVLVIYRSRILDIHISIVRDCESFGVPSFIIRTSADTEISNCMHSNGYDSGDDNDPQATKDLRRRCREQVIAQTEQNVREELQKAGLPPQRVYLVSRSKEFRRAYAAFISDPAPPTNDRGKFVHERELIRDLMMAAAARRCDTEAEERDIEAKACDAPVPILGTSTLIKCIHR